MLYGHVRKSCGAEHKPSMQASAWNRCQQAQRSMCKREKLHTSASHDSRCSLGISICPSMRFSSIPAPCSTYCIVLANMMLPCLSKQVKRPTKILPSFTFTCDTDTSCMTGATCGACKVYRANCSALNPV